MSFGMGFAKRIREEVAKEQNIEFEKESSGRISVSSSSGDFEDDLENVAEEDVTNQDKLLDLFPLHKGGYNPQQPHQH